MVECYQVITRIIKFKNSVLNRATPTPLIRHFVTPSPQVEKGKCQGIPLAILSNVLSAYHSLDFAQT